MSAWEVVRCCVCGLIAYAVALGGIVAFFKGAYRLKTPDVEEQ